MSNLPDIDSTQYPPLPQTPEGRWEELILGDTPLRNAEKELCVSALMTLCLRNQAYAWANLDRLNQRFLNVMRYRAAYPALMSTIVALIESGDLLRFVEDGAEPADMTRTWILPSPELVKTALSGKILYG